MGNFIFQENEKYCDICGLELSSRIVAIAHYQGKAHAKQKKRRDSGLLVKSEYKVKEDPTGRFGIGMSFVKAKDPPPGADDNFSEIKEGKGFYCVPCKLEIKTGDEYQQHLFGEKHRITTQVSHY